MIFYENPDFIKHLDIWLDISDQASAKWLLSYKTNIPQMFKNYSGTLYRGFIVPELPTKPFTIKNFTSWSRDKNMAMAFLKDPKYKVNKNQGIPILVSKSININKQILDIYSLALFLGEGQMIQLGIDDLAVDSALKEKEILVDKDIRIMPNEVKSV